MEAWPFDDPENVATISTRQAMQGGQPILWVSHDADDGSWQFHTGGPVEMADALVVSLRSVFQLDASIGDWPTCPWAGRRGGRRPRSRGSASRPSDVAEAEPGAADRGRI
jgi:hypothetical protein